MSYDLSAAPCSHINARCRSTKWGLKWGLMTALLPFLFVLGNATETVHGEDVWRGVDLSYINELEDCGAKYRLNGEVRDPYEIFREAGANIVRLRLWHTPDWTKYSTLPDVKRSIRRAKALGQRVLLDFHYSDDWVHPSKQIIPAAWRDIETTDELAEALYDYTLETLNELAVDGLAPDVVQVGNETNSELLLQVEKHGKHEIDWERNSTLLNAGVRAIRDFVKVKTIRLKSCFILRSRKALRSGLMMLRLRD